MTSPPRRRPAAISDQQASFLISNREDGAAGPFGRLLYHCDGMWSEWPFEVISLFAVEVEKPVIPTLYVSSVNGWATLPDRVASASVEGLRAEQVAGPEYVHERRWKGYEGELVQAKRDYVPSYETPVVHTHPRTGQPLLFVTEGMTEASWGWQPDDSEDLLEPIFEHLYAPENRLEFEWEPGDLVIWDNLSIQHGRPYVALEGPRAHAAQDRPSRSPEEAIAASLVNDLRGSRGLVMTGKRLDGKVAIDHRRRLGGRGLRHRQGHVGAVRAGGRQVVLVDHEESRARQRRRDRGEGGTATIVVEELKDPEAGERIIAEVGGGVRQRRHPGEQRRLAIPVPILDTDIALFDDIIAVNFRAPFFLTKAAIPVMKERGGGAVIYISSVTAHPRDGRRRPHRLRRRRRRRWEAWPATWPTPTADSASASTPSPPA